MVQPTDMPKPFVIRALGEIALACRDMAAMEIFYGETLGLRLLARRPNGVVFFDLAESFGGHRQVLALFPADANAINARPDSLHHLALATSYAEQGAAMDHFSSLGIGFSIENFDWIGWRGIFLEDPDGNTVELVARKPNIEDVN